MISIDCIYLKLLFLCCCFFVAYRDQGRRPYEVIVFFFFYIDLISICRVKNSSTDWFAKCIFHVLQKTGVLFECLTVQDGSEYHLIPIYWITE